MKKSILVATLLLAGGCNNEDVAKISDQVNGQSNPVVNQVQPVKVIDETVTCLQLTDDQKAALAADQSIRQVCVRDVAALATDQDGRVVVAADTVGLH